jgi:hypothetical protein
LVFSRNKIKFGYLFHSMQNFFTVLCLFKLWHVTIFLKWKIINSEIKDT